MSYADLTYYKTTWRGSGSDADITKYLELATDDIDILINNQIDITELTEKQIDYLKKANCSQTEYYIDNGYDEATNNYDSVSVGKVSLSSKNKRNTSILCDTALKYLEGAGLLDRSVRVCTSEYHDFC